MPDLAEPQLIARAVRAYGRPDAVIRDTVVRQLAGRWYVVIARHCNYPVVYRVHNNGSLRQMIQPPRELVEGDL